MSDSLSSITKENTALTQNTKALTAKIESLEKELANKDTVIYKEELMKPKFENMSALISNVFSYLEKIQNLPDFSTRQTRPNNNNLRSLSGSSKNSLSHSPVGMKSNTP